MNDAPDPTEEILHPVSENQDIVRSNQERIIENQTNIQENQALLQVNQGTIREALYRIAGSHFRIECVRWEHFFVGCGVFCLSVLVVWIAEWLTVSEHLPPLFHVVMATLFVVSLSVSLTLMARCKVCETRLLEWEDAAPESKD